jgi:hypothetical protein
MPCLPWLGLVPGHSHLFFYPYVPQSHVITGNEGNLVLCRQMLSEAVMRIMRSDGIVMIHRLSISLCTETLQAAPGTCCRPSCSREISEKSWGCHGVGYMVARSSCSRTSLSWSAPDGGAALCPSWSACLTPVSFPRIWFRSQLKQS